MLSSPPLSFGSVSFFHVPSACFWNGPRRIELVGSAYWIRKYTVSAVYTALSVAVVEPLPPKFSPPARSMRNGRAAFHAGSPAPAASAGAAATLEASSVLGETAVSCCVAQPVAARTASAIALARSDVLIGNSPLVVFEGTAHRPERACSRFSIL